jgi:predicted Zn-dependent protease
MTLARQGAAEQGDRLLASAAQSAPQKMQYPRSWAAALHLARREIELKRDEEALNVLAAARAQNPKIWLLAELQAETLRRTRGPEAAIPIIQAFADENWWQYSAHLALGRLKAQHGDTPGALAALGHACKLDVRETEALNLMARIQLRVQNVPAALAAQQRAVGRQPNQPSQYLLYSEVLTQMGRLEQARRALETARLLQQQARTSA